jgi:hypothetical protein
MFINRLDEAKGEANRDYREIKGSPRRTSKAASVRSNLSELGSSLSCEEEIQHKLSAEPKATQSIDFEEDEARDDDFDDDPAASLLRKCSEYLFDLFDANLMDGYLRIEAFEERAVKAFQNFSLSPRSPGKQVTEFTFEQEKLHREFLDIFEELIEEFLKEQNVTMEEFLKVVQDNLKGSRGRKAELANEVMDCIMWYSNFEEWAHLMYQEAQYKERNESHKTPLQQAILHDHVVHSKVHRLDV